MKSYKESMDKDDLFEKSGYKKPAKSDEKPSASPSRQTSQPTAQSEPIPPAKPAIKPPRQPAGIPPITGSAPRRSEGQAAGTSAASRSTERQATSVDTAPRRAERQATSVDTEPRRAERQATSVDTEPRRAERQATSVDTEPRRAERQATSVDTAPRRTERQSTSVDTAPRRTERQSTSVDTAPRRTEAAADDEIVISDTLFSQVFSRVNSCPQLDRFYEEAAALSVLTGESGRQYRVKKILSKEGGEAAILLCADPHDNNVVAKVFMHAEGKGKHSLQAREKVFRFMQTEEGKRTVLAVSDFGTATIQGVYHHYFEIMPYCPGGDMLGRKFTFDQLIPIIKTLNESLHTIHQAGIVHLDLKPDNLYQMEDGSILIGDFGVARVTQATNGKLSPTYTAVGTDGYRAPESVLAPTAGKAAYIMGDFSDYYSFGATIASLYEGRFIYQDMDAAEISTAIHNSHLPLSFQENPREQRKQELLYNLLDGLVRFDHSSRFDYNDVCCWLGDHEYTGAPTEGMWPKSFRFGGKDLRDTRQLFEAMTVDADSWEEAKVFLYENYFKDFFRSFRPDLARTAQRMEEDYRGSEEDVGVAMFLKALYQPGPIVWRGYTWHSLAELADKMMVTSTPKNYGQILSKKIISNWLKNTTGITCTKENLELVESIEILAAKRPEIACYWFGFSFASQKRFMIHGENVSDIAGLFRRMFSSAREFFGPGGGYDQLTVQNDGRQLYGFLASFGYWDRLSLLFGKTGRQTEFDRYEMMMRFMETVGEDSHVDMTLFREFYLNYGTVGPAYYVCKLQKEKKCYAPITSAGVDLVRKLEGCSLPKPDSIDAVRKKMQPLLELTEKLEKELLNNPYLAAAGVYTTASVSCNNLCGYFCYTLMGRSIPMGLGGLIEKN